MVDYNVGKIAEDNITKLQDVFGSDSNAEVIRKCLALGRACAPHINDKGILKILTHEGETIEILFRG